MSSFRFTMKWRAKDLKTEKPRIKFTDGTGMTAHCRLLPTSKMQRTAQNPYRSTRRKENGTIHKNAAECFRSRVDSF